MSHSAVELIELKREGQSLSGEAIEWFVSGYAREEIPDYQMAAMAMAIMWHGLDNEELTNWTKAMLGSGEVLNFDQIPKAKVDKHSTGGVGDKISIPLAPLVAACGIAVPMMSGRGLGHTGGTLDKLESIPGFTTRIDKERFREILEEHGLVLAGQSETIVPADRKLYALRDATGTVPSIPLISSSIMSKKLAEGLDGLILDVKVGSGAFMKDLVSARLLAETMVAIGSASGVETVAILTDMNQPLGYEVGNANEIAESVAVLRGEGPHDLTELTLTFARTMLELGGRSDPEDDVQSAIASGAALEKLKDVTRAHGGDPSVLDDPDLLPQAGHTEHVVAPRAGHVTRCDALTIGMATTRLGAGREKMEDTVDHSVGVTLHAKVGDTVEEGDILAVARFNDVARWEAQEARLRSAWEIGDSAAEARPLVLERVDRGRATQNQ